VAELVQRHTENPQWGLFGEPRVNVLELNLALDALPARSAAP
jgi:K+-transporting ATPase ATPase C chain